MGQFLEQLASEGYKITPQRRLILEVLEKSNKHMNAEEIAEEVKEKHPSISAATVYRNLSILVNTDIINKLDIHNGPARYEINRGHDHHMVCLSCGAAIKLGVCPMQGEIQKKVEENGFQVTRHHFEITGYCRECQKQRERDNKKREEPIDADSVDLT